MQTYLANSRSNSLRSFSIRGFLPFRISNCLPLSLVCRSTITLLTVTLILMQCPSRSFSIPLHIRFASFSKSSAAIWLSTDIVNESSPAIFGTIIFILSESACSFSGSRSANDVHAFNSISSVMALRMTGAVAAVPALPLVPGLFATKLLFGLASVCCMDIMSSPTMAAQTIRPRS